LQSARSMPPGGDVCKTNPIQRSECVGGADTLEALSRSFTIDIIRNFRMASFGQNVPSITSPGMTTPCNGARAARQSAGIKRRDPLDGVVANFAKRTQFQISAAADGCPRRGRHILIPLGLPDDIRGRPALPRAPRDLRVGPQRNLRRLVDIWATSILPRVASG
jgi:hypothetical protein